MIVQSFNGDLSRQGAIVNVDFRDCEAELLYAGGRPAKLRDQWLSHNSRREVHSFVQKFQHHFLYTVQRKMVRAVARKSRYDHALGDVQSHENLPEVRDFDTPYAFQYLFHLYLEEYKRIPCWSEFSGWMKGPAAPYYIEKFEEKFGLDRNHQTATARDRKHWRALRWRIGNLYYSAIREIDLMAALRENYDIHLKYHIFADVVLRCDFWIDNIAIGLYIGNEIFRSKGFGRKYPISEVFGEIGSPFHPLEVELPVEDRFSVVWLVSEQKIKALAVRIRNEAAVRSGSQGLRR